MSLESAFAAVEAAAPATPPATPPPEETTAAVPPAEEATPTEQPTEGAATEVQEVEQEPNLEDTPETSGDFAKYKPLFKDHPELRNIIGREQAYSALGSFSEVREIVQRIPTVADAEQLVADSENRQELGRTFREDVPTFVESLKNSDPMAFQKFASELPRVLAESDPEMWSMQARIYVPEVLTSQALMAQRDGDQATLDACQLLAQKLGIRLGAQPIAPQRDNSEAARLRKQIEERDKSDRETAFQNFWDQTDRVVIDYTVSAIENKIKTAVPQATEAQLKRMVNEAYSKTLEMLNSQPQTISRLNSFREAAQRGRQSITDHNTIVNFLKERTNLVVPKAAKSVIDEWTKTILKLNADSIEKKKAIAAQTRDVGNGPGATSSAAAATRNGQGKLHQKDILEQLKNGTYVPPSQRR